MDLEAAAAVKVGDWTPRWRLPMISVETVSTDTKRLASLLALMVSLELLMVAPTIATEGAKGRVRLPGAVDNAKDGPSPDSP